MQRFLLPVRLAAGLVCLMLTGPVWSGEWPSGFGAEASPAEQELAERPEPNGYFREMTDYWQGIPGLDALRRRWEGFAGGEMEGSGFAVLSALVSEAEGRPEEALAKLHSLTGGDARWNEGRLLALLGQEEEAVAVLAPLVLAAERPETGAAALIALTERDCLRGDFSGALKRTETAWAARPEEAFRMRILERHLSLLVEAGREREFLEAQVALAAKAKADAASGDNPEKAAASAARKVLAVMADWFTADPRLREARKKLMADYSTGIPSFSCIPGLFAIQPRPTMDCGTLWPSERELERLAHDGNAPLRLAGTRAGQIAAAGQWPQTLEGEPLLKRAFPQQPLYVLRTLFSNPDPTRPLPPLARNLADTMKPGVDRRILDLMERAWAGRAGPEDAENLAAIIVEAPQLRSQRREEGFYPQSSQWMTGWPAMPSFPTEQVIWNLSGETWAGFYRSSCRLAPLMDQRSAGFYPENSREPAWSQWRPEWPMEYESALTVWAWRQTMLMGQATPERAAAITGQFSNPDDRFLFAARCLRKELLSAWCRDAGLLRQVGSAALMQAAQALRNNGNPPIPEADSEAALAIAREMARRMDLNETDLIRSLQIFSQHASAGLKREMVDRPVNPVLAETLGMLMEWENETARAFWISRLPRTVPHPLYGIPATPSVERFRVLAAVLRQPQDSMRPSRFGSRFQRVAQSFFGGESPFGYEARAGELIRILEDFPTTNPVKLQILRWEALCAANNVGVEERKNRNRGFEKQEVNFARALREIAEEQQASMAWQLVRAMLEEDPVKRALLQEILESRSPLTAGAAQPPPEEAPDAQAPTAAAPSGQPTPETLTAMFMKMIGDPTTRKQLEPAGVMADMLRKGGRGAFQLTVQRTPPAAYPATAELLLKERDPLAARMAVILIARQSQPELTAQWLQRALAVFPEDPELLLAQASLESAQGEVTETGRAAFRRGLASLGKMMPFEVETMTAWCGISGGQMPSDAETVRALAAFIERSQPDSLPESWINALESPLHDARELQRLTKPELRSGLLALVRFKDGWRTGSNWMPLLDGLIQAGRKEAAATAAEALLSLAKGSLRSSGDPTEPAPPWNHSSGSEVTGPTTEGWKWLQLAERDDPAGLAERLRAVAAAHPADEQTALGALLALGRTRPLTAKDLKITASLSPAGAHRVLAYASWLLPADRLAEALVLEAWEAEALVEFSDVSNGYRNFLQGNAYLDRLENAGATGAARRVLPSLVEAVKTVGGFPEGYPGLIFRRLERLNTPDLALRLQTILIDLLNKTPQASGIPPNALLAAVVRAQLEKSAPAELPEELVRRVTAATEEGIRQQSPEAQEKNRNAETEQSQYREEDLLDLAYAAAGDFRWHGLLRRLLASRTKPGPDSEEMTDGSGSWHTLSILLGKVDSGRTIPEVELHFSPGGPGQGSLKWSFTGLMPPPLSDQERLARRAKIRLPWATLAAPLAGKFDALVLAADDDPNQGESVVARIESLPGHGEISLTELPRTGQLRLRLIRREAPQITAETEPLVCNTLPVLLDSALPPSPQTAHPAGWRLLCDPCPLNDADQWQVNGSIAAMEGAAQVALLLLDDSNQVCAMADLAGEERERINEGAPLPSGKILRSHLRSDRMRYGTKTGLQITGTPCRLALGVCPLPSDPGKLEYYSSQPFPRLIVHECPPAAPASPLPVFAGRLEILRSWRLPLSASSPGLARETNPAIRQSPLLAAWYDDGELTLIDLEKEDAPPRTLKLESPRGAALQGIHWTGPKLHLHFHSHSVSDENTTISLLYSFNTDTEMPPVKPYDFGTDVTIRSLDSRSIPDVLSIQTRGILYGILNPEGRILALEPSPDGKYRTLPTFPPYAISPTRIGFHTDNENSCPVLDWTDGTLRLQRVAKAEIADPEERKGSFLQIGEGCITDFSTDPPRSWRSPLSFDRVLSGGGDRVIAVIGGADGPSCSIVLMRKVPAKP